MLQVNAELVVEELYQAASPDPQSEGEGSSERNVGDDGIPPLERDGGVLVRGPVAEAGGQPVVVRVKVS